MKQTPCQSGLHSKTLSQQQIQKQASNQPNKQKKETRTVEQDKNNQGLLLEGFMS